MRMQSPHPVIAVVSIILVLSYAALNALLAVLGVVIPLNPVAPRALAAPAPLMLLDEPGEHLDALTADRLVTDLLTAGDQGRGTLLVTHRLSALEHADEVLVMGHRPQATGEQAPATILHRGSHHELKDVSEGYRWSLSQEDQDKPQDDVPDVSRTS